MRNSNRNAKVLAILAAAAGMTSSLQLAHATLPSFTWGVTNGSWQLGTNWVGGVAPLANDQTTDLTFNNSGAAYTTNNDFGGTFSLATMRFNIGGANAINVAGNPLSFSTNFNGTTGNPFMVFNNTGSVNFSATTALILGGNAGTLAASGSGTLAASIANVGTFQGSGAGSVNFNGTISSNVAPVGEAGAMLDWNKSGLGSGNINAGANLYAIRVEQGTVNQNGGLVHLTSTQRDNDPVGDTTIVDSTHGYWGLEVGTSAGLTGSYTVNNGTLVSDGFMVGVNAGSKGVFTLNNSTGTFLTQGSVVTGRVGVGFGSGTINVVNGSHLTTRLLDLNRQSDFEGGPSTSTMLVDNNSTVLASQTLLSRGFSVSSLTVSNNSTFQSDSFQMANAVDPSSGDPLGVAATVNVSNSHFTATTATGQGILFMGSTGAGTFNATNSTVNFALGAEIGDVFAGPVVGNAVVTLTNSSFHAGSFVFMNGQASTGGQNYGGLNGSTLSLNNGTFIMDDSEEAGPGGLGMIVGQDAAGNPTQSRNFISLTNNSHFIQSSDVTDFADGFNQNDAPAFTTVQILSGSTMVLDPSNTAGDGGTTSFGWYMATNSGSRSTWTISGAGSSVTTGNDDLRLANNTDTAGTLTISGGGTVSAVNGRLAMANLADDPDGSGTSHALVTVTDPGSKLTLAGIVQSGFFQDPTSGDLLPGGDATVIVQNGAALVTGFDIVGRTVPGTSPLTGQATFSVTGNSTATFNSAAVNGGDAVGELDIAFGDGTGGTLNIGAGSRVLVANGTGANVGSSQFSVAGGLDAKGNVLNNGTLAMGDTAIVGWDGQATFTNNGTATATDLIVGINGLASTSLHGVGSLNNTGTIVVANELDAGLLGLGSINSTGFMSVGGNAFLGADAGAVSRGLVTVNGGTFNVGNQMQVGGAGGTLGGASTFSITNNAFSTIGNAGTTGLLSVYSTSTVLIGSGTTKGNINVVGDTGVDGTIVFAAGTFKTSGNLDVAGRVLLTNAARGVTGTPTNKKLVDAGSLTFSAYANTGSFAGKVTSGLVDLYDNDAIFHSNTLGDNSATDVQLFIRSARTGGTWSGLGLTSTAAQLNTGRFTGLGAIRGSEYRGTHGGATATFDGSPVANGDVVVKYTFNGDSDLDGAVTGTDYAHIDTTFNNEHTAGPKTGWFNGDFNYDGVVDGGDYALIDGAFNAQKGPPIVIFAKGDDYHTGPGSYNFVSTGMDGAAAEGASLVHGATTRFGGLDTNGPRTLVASQSRANMLSDGTGGGASLQSVPEPSILGLTGLSMLGAMSRRRRASK